MSKTRNEKIKPKVLAFFILSILAFSFVLVFATDYPSDIIEDYGGAFVTSANNATTRPVEDYGGASYTAVNNETTRPEETYGGAYIASTNNETTLPESEMGGTMWSSGWNVTEVPICTEYGHGDVDNGYSVDVYSYWYCTDVNLDGYIFSHNATGSFVNSTWTSFDSPFNNTWANTSIPLDNDLGDTVVYYFYANSTSNKWNLLEYSGNFTVTATITFIKSQGCDMLKDGGNIANGTEITYDYPDTLNMTAVPDEGYFFDYWSWYAGTEESLSEQFDFIVDYTTTLYLYVNAEAPTEPEEPIIPPIGEEYSSLFYYFHDYAFAINNVTGYAMTINPPNDATSVQISTAGSANVSWGARVWVLYNGSTIELTSGTPALIGTFSGENASLLSGSFEISGFPLTFGKGALQLNLYSRWDAGAWTVRTIHVSDYLYYSAISDTNATVYLYVERTESGGNTISTARWGDENYVSGIADLIFKNPRGYDWQQYYLANGNFLSFLTSPYVAYLSNGFYAIVLFGLGMSIYIRYRQFSILAVFIVLMATGAGGVINLIVGEAFIGALWLIAAFGIALIYWRVFR